MRDMARHADMGITDGTGTTNLTGAPRSGTRSRLRAAVHVGLAAVAVLVMAGCLTVGKTFRVDGVKSIEIGKTTRDEIKKSLGEPWRTGVENGQRTWTYGHYRYSAFGTTMTRDLVVRFDDKDIVVAYNFNSTYAEDRALTGR